MLKLGSTAASVDGTILDLSSLGAEDGCINSAALD